MTFKFHKVV